MSALWQRWDILNAFRPGIWFRSLGEIAVLNRGKKFLDSAAIVMGMTRSALRGICALTDVLPYRTKCL